MRGDNHSSVYLRTFGTVELTTRHGPVPLRNTKARALIAFVALSPTRSCTRSELCDLLWPETDEKKARSSLRQCLSAIRRASRDLDDSLLMVEGERIGLDGALLSTDLESLLQRLYQQPPSAKILDDCLEARRILNDLSSVTSGFDTWAASVRSEAMDKVLTGLKQFYTDPQVDRDARIKSAQTALKLDAFEEEAVRGLMQNLAENGEASAALRHYGQFYDLLTEEMDAEPSLETQELAVAIKMSTGQARPHPSQPPGVPAAATGPRVSLAVLPFEVIGNTDDARTLSLGLLDHLTCHLASMRAPSVISSNTTRMYLGRVPRPSDVGRDLNARFLLSGSMRMDAQQVALALQLIETQTEKIVWANRMVSSKAEILNLNVPIAEEIARRIVPSVNAQELRLSRSLHPNQLEPYHLILQAKDLIFRLDKADFLSAGELLRTAIQSEPQFAPAHSTMADWLSIRIWEGWSEDVNADRTALDHHTRMAISLVPDDGRVMALWAHNRMMFNREYDEALSLLDKAIDLCPNDAEALVWSVPTLATTRNSEQAVRNGKRALDRSPLDPFLFRNEHFLSFAHFSNGDFEESIEYGMSCFRKAPNYSGNTRATIAALCAAGRRSEALSLAEHHNSLHPDFSVAEFTKIQGFRNPEDRAQFGAYLLEAGLPA